MDTPDLVWVRNVQILQQIWVNLVLWVQFTGIGSGINRFNPHLPHMPLYRFSVDVQ